MALLRDGGRVSERRLGETGRRHARTLVAELQSLLADEGLGPRDIPLVAVSIGPGSFTGLRVGVVCAKTWAFASGCRLLAVETFVAVVHRLPVAGAVAWVLDDALRGDIFVQRFEAKDDGPGLRWTAAGPVRLLPFDAWIQETAAGDVVAGPGIGRWRSRLEGGGLAVSSEEFWSPTAADVARCGREQAARGEFADPFDLVPMYVRRSAAEEKLESAVPSEGRS